LSGLFGLWSGLWSLPLSFALFQDSWNIVVHSNAYRSPQHTNTLKMSNLHYCSVFSFSSTSRLLDVPINVPKWDKCFAPKIANSNVNHTDNVELSSLSDRGKDIYMDKGCLYIDMDSFAAFGDVDPLLITDYHLAHAYKYYVPVCHLWLTLTWVIRILIYCFCHNLIRMMFVYYTLVFWVSNVLVAQTI